jgi:hypothetical protein
MVSMPTPTQTIPQPGYYGAGARALRVGIGKHVQHATAHTKSLTFTQLQTLHGEMPFCPEHVPAACQTFRNKKESLSIRPLQLSAAVPLGVFAAPGVKFCSTLAPADCQVYVADGTWNTVSSIKFMLSKR